jgi:hypothetical protein
MIVVRDPPAVAPCGSGCTVTPPSGQRTSVEDTVEAPMPNHAVGGTWER